MRESSKVSRDIGLRGSQPTKLPLERSSKQWSPGEIAGNYLLRSLSLLFSVLPRDLVFEVGTNEFQNYSRSKHSLLQVFGWLTPRELIKLVEVNRELRHLLMSQVRLRRCQRDYSSQYPIRNLNRFGSLQEKGTGR